MTGRPVSRRARARYLFDSAFGRGVWGIAAWLGLLTVVIVVAAGFLLQAMDISVNGQQAGFLEGIWVSLTRTLDPGTGGNDVGWTFRAISLAVTLSGIFVVTALIGLTANGIDRRLEELRRGRSRVVETGHTLVLGWSSKLATMLGELAAANDNRRHPCIVVLADRDKQLMDAAVCRWLPRGSRTKVVTRTGQPHSARDLALVGPERARSIVVLTDDSDPYGACTVKTALALLKADVPAATPMIVEVPDPQRARSLRDATDGRVLPVVPSEIIARITAQVCRQSGLSAVYQQLLDFDGDEIYIGPEMPGRSFGEALLAFEDSSVVGIRDAAGRITLAPAMDRRLAPGERIVAISRDDDTVVPSTVREPEFPAPPPCAPRQADRDHVLVLGWNEIGPHLLRELDVYAGPGATVRVLCDPHVVDLRSYRPPVRELDVGIVEGDTTDEPTLAKLFADRVPDHVIVLCYHALDRAEADARVLLSLLELRHLIGQLPEGTRTPTVVAEMLDVDDVQLAPTSAADDFVVSEKLTSYVLAQLAENPALAQVFDELLSAGGCEFLVRPAMEAVGPGRTTYAALVAACRARGEVAIAYRERDAKGRPCGVVVNPPKSREVDVGPHTEVVVLLPGSV